MSVEHASDTALHCCNSVQRDALKFVSHSTQTQCTILFVRRTNILKCVNSQYLNLGITWGVIPRLQPSDMFPVKWVDAPNRAPFTSGAHCLQRGVERRARTHH